MFSGGRAHISEAQEHGFSGGDGMLISYAVATVNYRGKRGGRLPTPKIYCGNRVLRNSRLFVCTVDRG